MFILKRHGESVMLRPWSMVLIHWQFQLVRHRPGWLWWLRRFMMSTEDNRIGMTHLVPLTSRLSLTSPPIPRVQRVHWMFLSTRNQCQGEIVKPSICSNETNWLTGKSSCFKCKEHLVEIDMAIIKSNIVAIFCLRSFAVLILAIDLETLPHT